MRGHSPSDDGSKLAAEEPLPAAGASGAAAGGAAGGAVEPAALPQECCLCREAGLLVMEDADAEACRPGECDACGEGLLPAPAPVFNCQCADALCGQCVYDVELVRCEGGGCVCSMTDYSGAGEEADYSTGFDTPCTATATCHAHSAAHSTYSTD